MGQQTAEVGWIGGCCLKSQAPLPPWASQPLNGGNSRDLYSPASNVFHARAPVDIPFAEYVGRYGEARFLDDDCRPYPRKWKLVQQAPSLQVAVLNIIHLTHRED